MPYTCSKGKYNLIFQSDQVISLANLMIDMKYLHNILKTLASESCLYYQNTNIHKYIAEQFTKRIHVNPEKILSRDVVPFKKLTNTCTLSKEIDEDQTTNEKNIEHKNWIPLISNKNTSISKFIDIYTYLLITKIKRWKHSKSYFY